MPYSPEEQKIAADFIDFCARQNKLPSALDIDDVVKKYRAANVFGKPKAPGMTGWGPSQEELGRSKIAPKVPSSFVPETISEVGKMPGYDKDFKEKPFIPRTVENIKRTLGELLPSVSINKVEPQRTEARPNLLAAVKNLQIKINPSKAMKETVEHAGTIAMQGVKGIGEQYTNLGSAALKYFKYATPPGLTLWAAEEGLKKLGVKAKMPTDWVAEKINYAKKAYIPDEWETKILEEGGLPAKIESEVIKLAGDIPLMVLGGPPAAAGAKAIMAPARNALEVITPLMEAKFGKTVAPKVLKWLLPKVENALATQLMFGGKALAEDIGANRTFGDILKTQVKLAESTPAFIAGHILGGPKMGIRKAGAMGGSFAAASAITGGTVADNLNAFFTGAAWSMIPMGERKPTEERMRNIASDPAMPWNEKQNRLAQEIAKFPVEKQNELRTQITGLKAKYPEIKTLEATAIVTGAEKIKTQPTPVDEVKYLGAGAKPLFPPKPLEGIETVTSEHRKFIDKFHEDNFAPADKKTTIDPLTGHPMTTIERLDYEFVSREEVYSRLEKGLSKSEIDKIPSLYRPKIVSRLRNNVQNMVDVMLGIAGGDENVLTKLVTAMSSKVGFEGGKITLTEGIKPFKGGTFKLTPEDVKFTGESLKEIYKPLAKNWNDVENLWLAKTEIARFKDLKPGEKIEGLTVDKANTNQKLIDALKKDYGEGFQKLDDAVTRVMKFENRAILGLLYESGRINADELNAMSAKPHIPADRLLQETMNADPVFRDMSSSIDNMLTKFKGSEELIKKPTYNLIHRMHRVTAFYNYQNLVRAISQWPERTGTWGDVIRWAKEGENNPRTVTLWEDGKSRKLVIGDPYLFEQVKYTPEVLNLADRLFKGAKELRRAGATLPLAFGQRNVWRDINNRFIIGQKWHLPFVSESNALPHLAVSSESFQKFLVTGAGGAYFEDLNNNKSNYLKLLADSRGMEDYVKHPLDALKRIGTTGENMTRAAEFLSLLGGKDGKGALRAGYAARDLADFGNWGNSLKHVRHWSAFYTANIVGAERIYRAFKEHPVRSSVRSVMMVTIPKLVEYALWNDNEQWKELPMWRKMTFFNIPTGSKTVPFITLPMPWEPGLVFGGIPLIALDYAKNKDARMVKEFGDQVLETILPGIYGIPIPDIFQPILEHKFQRNFFFGSPLPSRATADLPAEKQYTERTTRFAKWLGQISHQSPEIIDNYIFGYTGGMGRDVYNLGEGILGKTRILPTPGNKVPDPWEITRGPFMRGVTSGEYIGTSSDAVNRLYELYGSAMTYNKGLKKLELEGETNTSLWKVYREKSQNLKTLQKYVEDIGAMRKEQTRIKNNPKMVTAEKTQKVYGLDVQITEKAREYLNVIKKNNGVYPTKEPKGGAIFPVKVSKKKKSKK